MNYIGYIRVSGKSQVEGDGPERQEMALIGYAQSQGHILRYYSDLAVSGTVEALDRPGLASAINDAVTNGATILVERADRIARDLIVSELFFRECRERGVKVIAVDSGEELVFTDEDPTRKLIRQIMGALSEWEKSVIVKKLKAGRDKKRRETGRCGGRLPYGQGSDEQAVLRHIRKDRAEGYSFKHIAMSLNMRGFRSRDGNLWHKGTVARVFKQHLKD